MKKSAARNRQSIFKSAVLNPDDYCVAVLTCLNLKHFYAAAWYCRKHLCNKKYGDIGLVWTILIGPVCLTSVLDFYLGGL
jgi:hypothetical protein